MATVIPYYLYKNERGVLELRQNRFKAMFEDGHDHPNDVCGVACTRPQMEGILRTLKINPDDMVWPN